MEKSYAKAIVAALLLMGQEEEKDPEHPTNVPNAIVEADRIISHCEKHPDEILKMLSNGLSWDHMKEIDN